MIFKFAIKDFIDEKEFNQLSPKTIGGYKQTLHQFQSFCMENSVCDVCDVTKSTVKAYLLHCQKQRNNNPVSINTKLRAIKVFFNYMEKADIIDHKSNPTRELHYLKTVVKIEVLSAVK